MLLFQVNENKPIADRRDNLCFHRRSLDAPQSHLSSSKPQPNDGRPTVIQVRLFGLMEFGGDALLDRYKPSRQHQTVQLPDYNLHARPRDTMVTLIEPLVMWFRFADNH
ncbi:hypothetical protein SAMN06265222_101877 [Neorhodopirellula lusitana]|uniref:Uncharacterized protein n=1 Tax=Neorhodopirellula lusitana TaxID=445327 RepID=A0ABY1PU98_9BACT|nr:hypothetical protein SAMN06265222_101877 [Neorhodopirellula lusitana]